MANQAALAGCKKGLFPRQPEWSPNENRKENYPNVHLSVHVYSDTWSTQILKDASLGNNDSHGCEDQQNQTAVWTFHVTVGPDSPRCVVPNQTFLFRFPFCFVPSSVPSSLRVCPPPIGFCSTFCQCWKLVQISRPTTCSDQRRLPCLAKYDGQQRKLGPSCNEDVYLLNITAARSNQAEWQTQTLP